MRGAPDDTAERTVPADLRFLAFYLPQFHPIPENDAWWGPGFTEWTNVTKARRLFAGHYQPHVPDRTLGFYDLRDPETRELQSAMARAFGVDGFVYYHYWFAGRRLLERPFNEVLSSGTPQLPFCICWANENWTRSWDGGDQEMLVEQRYGDDDDRAHMRWLAEAFSDPRYIRIGGRPVLLVYRASHLTDARRTTDIWRQEAARLGIGELYLCRVESFATDRGDPTELGFDAAVEFQPDWLRSGRRLRVPDGAAHELMPDVFSYQVAVELAMSQAQSAYKRFRCVTPGWDNTPRRGANGTVYVASTPAAYERWLTSVVDSFQPYSAEENLVFINAWNEWGEGCHLEPDSRWGRGYLEAHLRATRRAEPPAAPHPAPTGEGLIAGGVGG